MAARNSERPRYFRPPVFKPAVSPVRRLVGLVLPLLSLSGISLGAGVVWPRLSQPSEPSQPAQPSQPARTTPLESMPSGFDISHFQAPVDWPTVLKNKPHFVFVKATEGQSFLDPRFQDNWSALANAGVRRGAYHFYRPQDSASAQADFFLKTVRLEPGDLPPVLDVEVTDAVKRDELISGVKAWLTQVEKALQRKPIIYSDTVFWREQLGAGFQDYPLWMAGRVEEEGPWSFWQLGSNGEVKGLSGCVDRDVFLGTEEEFDVFLRTGVQPKPGGVKLPALSRCARPTQSTEPPVPVQVADGGTPSPPDAGTPVPGTKPSKGVPYQEGMTPDPPRLLHPGEPLIYPERALLQGVEGEAILMCTIGTSGAVTNCRAIKFPTGLADALIQMMSTRRYQPMTFKGRTVAVEYPFYINVKLPPGYERR
ncbi:GH25 family lysozyme [Corallococcus aberystwythensis]|uniref:TonB C-terminal domain-containing protein n=1 Tax=Corallococcus aberystwythensis TaxID=2316722 RepID=A0A3A8QAW8_9BACT|nr:GH25 family lysozyme [Corallococcus aberystwythensis]RKH65318.1 hypothetical protein D7W81_17065 [Corallococcus aberystwythensis]